MIKNKEINIIDDLEITDYFRDKKLLVKTVKNKIRKLKIGNILSDTDTSNMLHFDKNNVPNPIKPLIRKYGKYGIITGSTLLCMYGLSKHASDLDLIVNSENFEKIKHKVKENDMYNEFPKYQGIIKVGSYSIDIFLDDDAEGEERDGILIDSLSHSLNEKITLFEEDDRGKDFHDFHIILKCIKDSIYINHQKNNSLIENFKNLFISKY